MTIFIINGGVTFEKFLITVVIILLIGALGFAIYAAINHSTSSNHNNEQDNKATHQKKDTEVNHQKTKIQTTQMKIKTTTVLLMAINHLRHQLSKITVQQHQRIHNHLIRINQIQINLIRINQIQITAVAVNLQRITKIINNRTHHLLINQIIPIRLLNKHLKYNHLKLIIYLIRPQVSGT